MVLLLVRKPSPQVALHGPRFQWEVLQSCLKSAEKSELLFWSRIGMLVNLRSSWETMNESATGVFLGCSPTYLYCTCPDSPRET